MNYLIQNLKFSAFIFKQIKDKMKYMKEKKDILFKKVIGIYKRAKWNF